MLHLFQEAKERHQFGSQSAIQNTFLEEQKSINRHSLSKTVKQIQEVQLRLHLNIMVAEEGEYLNLLKKISFTGSKRSFE